MNKKLLAMAISMLLFTTACTTPPPSSSTPSTVVPPVASTSEETISSSLPTTPQAELDVAVLKGLTVIGMLPLMEKSAAEDTINQYDFTVATAPDQIVGDIVNGNLDIAAVPTNLAATIYNKTGGEVAILAINTLGVLSIVENGDSIQSMSDLKGKTMYATGKGSTPQYALDFLLEQNGLVSGTDVVVEYKAEHSEVATMLGAGMADIALLPQPFVTSALMKNPDLRIAIDFTEEWERVTDGASQLAMSTILVQKSLLTENPEAVLSFMEEYSTSAHFAMNPENIDAVATLAVAHEIFPNMELAKMAIPACNITYIAGEEMKTLASGYLEVLHKANPKSVGGTLPNEDFYYTGI